ncbi:unnamed protein product [Brassica oleracea]|uniref:Peptidase C1A papain C-terminal domain-containing protein n=2 Tax=Brassica TaxID=3705 RepID=A0A0D3D653_BRAOL|nr:unnamed protein product [Brassica napus]
MLPWNWNVSRVGESKDWRKEGVVTPVKKQGGCGKLARITYYNKSLRIVINIWGWCLLGVLDDYSGGRSKISGGNLVSLSEQQLIYCDRARNHGCKCGSMTYAFQYISNVKSAMQIRGFNAVPQNNERALLEAVPRGRKVSSITQAECTMPETVGQV